MPDDGQRRTKDGHSYGGYGHHDEGHSRHSGGDHSDAESEKSGDKTHKSIGTGPPHKHVEITEQKGGGGVRFNQDNQTAANKRATKHLAAGRIDTTDDDSDNEHGKEDLSRASWTTASFTEVPNALDELEHQHHPSKTTQQQQHVQKQIYNKPPLPPHPHTAPPSSGGRTQSHDTRYSTPAKSDKGVSQTASDMHQLLVKHGADTKSSVLAKYFKSTAIDEATQAGVPSSDWLSRLEQMLIHFFLMLFESSSDSSKLIMEMMPTEAAIQVEEIFQLLLKAEPEMYHELGNLVGIAENWLILWREDSEKRQKALDYVRIYMDRVKDNNYYKLPLQVRLHKLGAFIAGLNNMGVEAMKYPVYKNTPPINEGRIKSPRCKPATHFSRVVANILGARPCNDPLPSEDVYADQLGEKIFKNTLHGDSEFKTYTDRKYGAIFKKSDVFNPFYSSFAYKMGGGDNSFLAEFYGGQRGECVENKYCWLPKYSRSYVEKLKGGGCEILAKNDFEKAIAYKACDSTVTGEDAEACKAYKKDAPTKKDKKDTKKLYEWVRGSDGKVYRKSVGAYTELGKTGSLDSVLNVDRSRSKSPRGKGESRYKGARGKSPYGKGRGKEGWKSYSYTNKVSSDSEVGHYGRGGHGRGRGNREGASGRRPKGGQGPGRGRGGYQVAGGRSGGFGGGGGAGGGRGQDQSQAAKSARDRAASPSANVRAQAVGGTGGQQGGAGGRAGPGGGGGQGPQGIRRGVPGKAVQSPGVKGVGKTGPVNAYRLERLQLNSALNGSGDSGSGDDRDARQKKAQGAGDDKNRKQNDNYLPGVGASGKGRTPGQSTSNKYGQRPASAQARSQSRGYDSRTNNRDKRSLGHRQSQTRIHDSGQRGYDSRAGGQGGRGRPQTDYGRSGRFKSSDTYGGKYGRSRRFQKPSRSRRFTFDDDEWEGEQYNDDDDYMQMTASADETWGGIYGQVDPKMLTVNQCWERAAKIFKKPGKALVIPPVENLILYLEKKFPKARWPRGYPVATRQYPNGGLFVAQYGNGSSRVFYPHGGLAVSISGPSPVASQILVVRDPSDGTFFFDKALIAEINSSGKGVIYGEDGIITAQYSAIGGFKVDGMARGHRWHWNQGGQRLALKLNNFLSLRISDQDRIFLNFYGNARGFLVNVANGYEVVLMNPRRDNEGMDSIHNQLKSLLKPKLAVDHFDYIRGRFRPPLNIGFVDKPQHYAHFFKRPETDIRDQLAQDQPRPPIFGPDLDCQDMSIGFTEMCYPKAETVLVCGNT